MTTDKDGLLLRVALAIKPFVAYLNECNEGMKPSEIPGLQASDLKYDLAEALKLGMGRDRDVFYAIAEGHAVEIVNAELDKKKKTA